MRPFALRRIAAPAWAVHASLAAATLLIGASTVASHDASSPFPLLYVCVATAAFVLLNRAGAVIQASLVVAVYATSVSLLPGHHVFPAVSRFAIFGVTLFVGAMLLDSLRVKQRNLADRISELSRNDVPNRLLDRREIDDALATEVERAGRSGVRFAVIKVALDDERLDSGDSRTAERSAQVGTAILRALRSIDFAGRLDTNLFSILAIYTDERGAETLVERIRTRLGDIVGDESVPALSFGIAVYGRHGTSAPALLETAASALDEARSLGGDRSILAPTRLQIEATDNLRNPQVLVAKRAASN